MIYRIRLLWLLFKMAVHKHWLRQGPLSLSSKNIHCEAARKACDEAKSERQLVRWMEARVLEMARAGLSSVLKYYLKAVDLRSSLWLEAAFVFAGVSLKVNILASKGVVYGDNTSTLRLTD